MSICNNLKQYGIPYSLTTLHTEAPDSPEFKADLAVVRRRLPRRARPQESAHRRHRRTSHRLQHRSLLARSCSRAQRHLPSRRSTCREIFGRIERMKDNDDAAQAKLAAIKNYIPTSRHPRSRADEDGEARRGDRWLDEGRPNSPSAPSSAGPRWKNSSASCPAPS